jgi:hypothetical protein
LNIYEERYDKSFFVAVQQNNTQHTRRKGKPLSPATRVADSTLTNTQALVDLNVWRISGPGDRIA